MLVPQINSGSTYQSSLLLLINLFMSDYDTCVFYKDKRSSENNDLEDSIYSMLFQNEKSVITLEMTDPSSDHILLKVNKNHLNIYLISYVDSNAINHLHRIYNQSNQYDVWNLIFIYGRVGRVDRIINLISKESTIISSTTLVTLSMQHGLYIWNESNDSWTQLTTINSSLNIQKEMFEKHVNLHGQELVVSFTTHPLTNFLIKVLKQPLFIGMDAFIGVEIYEHINARPVYSNALVEKLIKIRKIEIIGTQDEVRKEIEMQRRFVLHSSPYFYLIFDLSKLDKILIK